MDEYQQNNTGYDPFYDAITETPEEWIRHIQEELKDKEVARKFYRNLDAKLMRLKLESNKQEVLNAKESA